MSSLVHTARFVRSCVQISRIFQFIFHPFWSAFNSFIVLYITNTHTHTTRTDKIQEPSVYVYCSLCSFNIFLLHMFCKIAIKSSNPDNNSHTYTNHTLPKIQTILSCCVISWCQVEWRNRNTNEHSSNEAVTWNGHDWQWSDKYSLSIYLFVCEQIFRLIYFLLTFKRTVPFGLHKKEAERIDSSQEILRRLHEACASIDWKMGNL